MAVTAIYPNLATAPNVGELDERSQRRYSVTWFVETDDILDGPQIVGDAPGLPRLFSVYKFGNDVDVGSTCKRIRPRRLAGEQKKWEVEFEYDSTLHTEAEGNRDPLLRPPKVKYRTMPYQAVASHDVFGKAIENRAHEEYNEAIMKDDSRFALIVTRNEFAFQVALAFTYRDAVANDTFFGFAPFEPKMMSIESDLVPDNASTHWETTYVIHFKERITSGAKFIDTDGKDLTFLKPWNKNYAHRSFYQKAGGRKRINDDDGKPTVVPWPIGKNGERLPGDTPRDQQFVISHQVYQEKPFAALGLP